ncbi:hypothetical protein A6D98_19555 [Aliivibrio fischeri]|uniref:hypothetical protein n=1 Tax=Aliivibrio fischeri TaxID=668 RepID=UPI00080ED991|nr:hypothetical protein [Aliivibrio fischeri]OCH01423.1 hypothetical protein A6E10_19185 [Aliivibrio fischeri]OCH57284.1 hypothetical protein A6D98_19555 [Aliivibrio fischeri]
MKVSNREFGLIMLSALLFAACFISFGTIIGQVSFKEADAAKIFSMISALGGFLAGIGTIGLLFLAPRALKDWRSKQQIHLVIELKKDLIVSQEAMFRWFHEACLCGTPPREDKIALTLKEKADDQLMNMLKTAAHWDALHPKRKSWLLDEMISVEKVFTTAYRNSNYPMHYSPVRKNSEGELLPFDKDEAIEKRNEDIFKKLDKVADMTNSIINKLDKLDESISQ